MADLTIFPTPLEQLRYLTQLFDLSFKGYKKALDDKAHKKIMTPILIDSCIKKALREPITDKFGSDIALLVERRFRTYLDTYIKDFVASEMVMHLTREEFIAILAKSYFPWVVYELVIRYLPLAYSNKLDFAELFNPNQSSMRFTLSWLDNNRIWQSYVSTLDTKQKDKIGRWRRGEYLPSLSDIKNVNDPDKSRDWIIIRFWLLMARALDELRKSDYAKDFFESLYALLKAENEDQTTRLVKAMREDLFASLDSLQTQKNEAISDFWVIFNQLDSNYLHLKTQKQFSYKDDSAKLLETACQIAEINQLPAERIAGLTWLHARWHLFSGNLAGAVETYEKAFNDALYCLGNGLQNLIIESLTAAAYLEQTTEASQRKFLARLKNTAVFFGYELSALNVATEKLNHKEIVADWEVEMWANSFHQVFPLHSYFDGVAYLPILAYQKRLINKEDLNKIKPNYKKPNKTVGFADKRMSQLVLFSSLYNFSTDSNKFLDYIEKLLEAGADVNQLSSNGESALLFAIEALDLEAIPSASQDRRLFDLLIDHANIAASINQATTKREKFPLMQAVKTGRPDVVEKILKLGADVNQVDNLKVSPLFQVMRMIHKLKMGKEAYGKTFQQRILNDQTSYNNIEKEYFRREHGATAGLSHSMFYSDVPRQRLAHLSKIPNGQQLLWELSNTLSELEFNSLEKYTSLNDLYRMVELLVAAGANPNQPHSISVMQGYTPLMYAVELNDPVLFKMLKNAEGDVDLTTTVEHQGKLKSYTLDDIKKQWQSDKIEW